MRAAEAAEDTELKGNFQTEARKTKPPHARFGAVATAACYGYARAMESSDRQSLEGEKSAACSGSEVACPTRLARESSPKIRLAHPKGVFRFKTFEEKDAWDAIYEVPIRVK